jgi:hypothetical protein
MDDFIISNLNDSRNEWCERLIYILTTHICEGIRSIFNESLKMCLANNEPVKYLMTFQNLLSKIPQWNSVIIQEEVNRIIKKSECNYISELIACVHIIQLKVLTCVRVGNKQKKIDIAIPKLEHFIHSVYIQVARKIYTNVYLFEKGISPLQMQKNNREVEIIVKECILITIRESIPTEQIVRAYLDETVEHEEEIIIENIEESPGVRPEISSIEQDNKTDKTDKTDKTEVENITKEVAKNEISNNYATDDNKIKDEDFVLPTVKNMHENTEPVTTLKFNDIDYVLDENNERKEVKAPKDIDTLEEISMTNLLKRKLQEENEYEEEENDKIKIMSEDVNLGDLEILDVDNVGSNLKKGDSIVLTDVEELF